MTSSYTYNSSGIRTKKTVDGITTNYFVVDGQILMQYNDIDKLVFFYDTTGNLSSMELNGILYHYLRNAQGDITGITDSQFNVVAKYFYDTWGKLIKIEDGLGNDKTNDTSTVGYKNPFRYRGYYYDTETGLYYLQSRYYDSEVGRFINADVYVSTGQGFVGNNMFAYCNNNGVPRKGTEIQPWKEWLH